MIGFLQPTAWLLGGLVLVLVALYLWERSRHRVDVPSLLLWQVVPETPPHATRFRPDWLFVLQCVLLLMLVAGLADPFWRSAPARHATAVIVVLDASASMQAREGRHSRFELAQDAIRRRIGELNPSDEIMLIEARTRPHVVVPFTRDHAATLNQLAGLEPIAAAATLTAALALAERAARHATAPTIIELYSDSPADRLQARWRDRVHLVQFGETDDNVAIDGLQVTQSRFQDARDIRAYATIHNFAHREAHGVMTFQLDDRIFDRRGFTLAPRSVSGFHAAPVPGPGVLRASLDVPDALTADNVAFAYVRPSPPLRVRVVTSSTALHAALEQIGAATPNLEIVATPPNDYRGAEGAQVVVFHRHVAPPPEDAASLYVAPQGDASPFPLRGLVANAPVLDWASGHPVLAGIRPELPFPLTTAEDLDLPAWAESIISSRVDGREIPLVAVGEQHGRRQAVMAFDLESEALLEPDHLNLLLLLLNLLDWLAPIDAPVRIVHTGEVVVLDTLPPLPRRIIDPRQHESVVSPAAALAFEAEHAGAYRVSADGTTVRVFANLADPGESDIGRAPRSTGAPISLPPTKAADLPHRGLGTWCAAIAALLLLTEWLAARRAP